MSTARMPSSQGPEEDQLAEGDRPQVDPAKLWPGGFATAIVAALAALVGVVMCRWLFGIPLLAPTHDGAYGDAHTTDLMLLAGAAALAATGLVYLLLLSTPRPMAFFGWIVGLATAFAMLMPFGTSAPLAAKVATATVALVLGVTIGSLVSSVAARSVRRPRPRHGSPLLGSFDEDRLRASQGGRYASQWPAAGSGRTYAGRTYGGELAPLSSRQEASPASGRSHRSA
jgi:hypothetical protein